MTDMTYILMGLIGALLFYLGLAVGVRWTLSLMRGREPSVMPFAMRHGNPVESTDDEEATDVRRTKL
jgi:hypothetical protein